MTILNKNFSGLVFVYMGCNVVSVSSRSIILDFSKNDLLDENYTMKLFIKKQDLHENIHSQSHQKSLAPAMTSISLRFLQLTLIFFCICLPILLRGLTNRLAFACCGS